MFNVDYSVINLILNQYQIIHILKQNEVNVIIIKYPTNSVNITQKKDITYSLILIATHKKDPTYHINHQKKDTQKRNYEYQIQIIIKSKKEEYIYRLLSVKLTKLPVQR